MYFWDIEHLKEDLVFGRHDESMAIRYFFAMLTVEFLLSFFQPFRISSPTTRLSAYLTTVIGALLYLVGAYLAFRRNGGWSGQYFFTRFFPVLWVVFIRFAGIFFVPVSLGVWIIGLARGMHPDDIRQLGYLAALVGFILMYWRIGEHMRDIARAATPNPGVHPTAQSGRG